MSAHIIANDREPRYSAWGDPVTNLAVNPDWSGIAGASGIRAAVADSGGLLITPDIETTRGVTSLGHTGAAIPIASAWTVGQRIAIRLPAPMTRFRVGLRNVNYLADLALSGEVGVPSIHWGVAERDSLGRLTGRPAAGSVRLDTAGLTVTGAAPTLTPWLTMDLDPAETYMLSMQIETDAPVSIGAGGTLGWLVHGTDPADPAATLLGRAFTLLDMWIEWDGYAPGPTFAVIGHSLNNAGNVAPDEHPWEGEHEAWHNLVAARLGGVSYNLAVGGAWTANFETSTFKRDFFDSSGATPNYLVLFISSSDLAGGRTMTEVLESVVNIAVLYASKFPLVKTIIFTEPGRIALNGKADEQAQFDAYNAYVRNQMSLNGWIVIDAGPALSWRRDPHQLRPDLNADGEHFTVEGHRIVADLATPLMPVLGREHTYTGADVTYSTGHALDAGTRYTLVAAVSRDTSPAGYEPPRLRVQFVVGEDVTVALGPPAVDGVARLTIDTPAGMPYLGYGLIVVADGPDPLTVEQLTLVEGDYDGPTFSGATPLGLLARHAWTGTPDESPSTREERSYTWRPWSDPLAIIAYEVDRDSRTLVHDLLDGGIAVTLTKPRLESGTWRLIYATQEDARQGFDLHTEDTTYTLTDPTIHPDGITYVIAPGRAVRMTLDPDTRQVWHLEVPYQEVTP